MYPREIIEISADFQIIFNTEIESSYKKQLKHNINLSYLQYRSVMF